MPRIRFLFCGCVSVIRRHATLSACRMPFFVFFIVSVIRRHFLFVCPFRSSKTSKTSAPWPRAPDSKWRAFFSTLLRRMAVLKSIDLFVFSFMALAVPYCYQGCTSFGRRLSLRCSILVDAFLCMRACTERATRLDATDSLSDNSKVFHSVERITCISNHDPKGRMRCEAGLDSASGKVSGFCQGSAHPHPQPPTTS